MSNKYGGLNNNTIKNWYPPPPPFFCFWTAPGIHHFQEIWPKQHLQSCLNWTVFTHRTLWVTGLFLSTWVTFWSSRTWEEHIHHTQAELQHLQETYVKAEKWEFYTSSFLPGIHCGWREPWDRSSEGFRHLHLDYAWELEAGAAFSQLFYRCFIQNYSTMAAPLTVPDLCQSFLLMNFP